MACQEEIVLFIIILATGHANWRLQLYEEVRHNFCICCKAWFKAEAGLSLTLPCASVWKGGGCTLLLSYSLRLETKLCFVLARGTLAC